MNFRHMAALIGLALPGLAVAQKSSAPVVLLLPGGTRALGLGNTGVASRDDEVIFYNPAMLMNATGMSASGEYFSSTAGMGSLSAVTRFNGGGIGIGMQFASFEVGDAFAPPPSRASMIEPGVAPGSAVMAVIGYGQTVKGVRVGVAGKFAQETYGNVRLSRPAADIGVSKDFFRTTFALAVQNLGDSQMSIAFPPPPQNVKVLPAFTYLPLKSTLGAAKSGQLGEFDYAVTGAVSLLRDEFVQPSGGVELNYSWLSGYNVAVRAGARRTTIGEEPFTAGAGFTADRLTFDYALETLSNQRVGHRFGIRVR